MIKFQVIVVFLVIALSQCFVDKALYDEIKSKATFEVLDYEVVKEIFGDRTTADYSKHNGENHLISPQMQELLKSGISSESFLDAEEFNVKVKSLPAEFDWRKYRPDCITPIKDQMYCGSCYSFSVTSVLESRFCIQSNGRLKPELSQQDIVSCDTNSMKCSGAYLDTTWRFLEYYGTCSLQCKPYESGYGSVPACYGGCTNPALSYYKWRAIYGSFKFLAEPVYANRINQIKMEIYQYGPVSAVMETYEDMATFKGGVYIHTAGKKTDYHAITIVGWGYDSYYRSEYWIMRNSWGTKWGDAGYAKILFNYYQIESQMNASQPLI